MKFSLLFTLKIYNGGLCRSDIALLFVILLMYRAHYLQLCTKSNIEVK